MKNLNEFFKYMHDVDFPYVVIRNFETLPTLTEGHNDIDLLVLDYKQFREIFPTVYPEHSFPRVRFKLVLGTDITYLDVRFMGDGYFPVDIEEEMLKSRQYDQRGFFIPSPHMFRIGLIYHVVHHKNFNKYQQYIGNASVEEYLNVLKEGGVGYSIPTDPSVGKFNQYFIGATSIVSRENGKIIKTQNNYNSYDLIENEYRILSTCHSDHFPLVWKREASIEIEDCGERLSIDNLPQNWREQLVCIVLDLEKYNLMHRDIKPDNLMVKDGKIKLIDFGWAKFYDEEDSPPNCLGYPYKPSWGYDDRFSMRKVMKEMEYKLEESLCVS